MKKGSFLLLFFFAVFNSWTSSWSLTYGMFWHAEAGKGCLGIRDIERAATAHDFMWSDKELADMIRCFDSDGDRKVSVDSFFHHFIWL